MATSFRYAKRLEGRQIRLLEVLPPRSTSPYNTSDPLELRVVTQASLEEADEFWALSYVWGGNETSSHPLSLWVPLTDAEPTEETLTISENRYEKQGEEGWQLRVVDVLKDRSFTSFPIGFSLGSALTEYRRRGIKNLLWVDAICINQRDDVEKTAQVRIMREIYARAKRTVIWLGREGDLRKFEGEPWDNSSPSRVALETFALDMLGYMFKQSHGEDNDSGEGDGDEEAQIKMNVDNWRGLPPLFDDEALGLPHPAKSTLWKALFHILEHRWFSRVWVIQELLSSRDAVMWRGAGLQVPAIKILWLARQIQTLGKLRQCCENVLSVTSPPPISSPSSDSSPWPSTGRRHSSTISCAKKVAMQYLVAEGSQNNLIPFCERLLVNSSMQATDLRDRYFALVGLSDDVDAGLINYDISLADLVYEVGLIALFDHTAQGWRMRGLEWLARPGHCQHLLLPFPSWIPDFLNPAEAKMELTWAYPTCPENESSVDYRIRMDSAKEVNTKHAEFAGEFLRCPSLELIRSLRPRAIELRGCFTDRIARLCLNPHSGEQYGKQGTWLMMDPASPEGREVYLAALEIKIRWIRTIRLLVDPSLKPADDITAGKNFETFWRTLIYDCNAVHDRMHPWPTRPKASMGLSFAAWFALQKLQFASRDKYNQERFGGDIQAFNDAAAEYQRTRAKLLLFAQPFSVAYRTLSGQRDFFVSEQGRFGWVPEGSRIGDRIAFIRGQRVPFVARPAEEQKDWLYAGSCYVHGMMDFEVEDQEETCWEWINLV
ncbi:heterokaryon incompatibility protein-domain-containing protein [Xylariaceae sp. FL0255]|nr:heterokaryon incompatibility protein-domain-containing protein [Xylariaceae sp. FL0255]